MTATHPTGQRFDGGDVTLSELARLIERNHAETREDFQSVFTRMDREYQEMKIRMDGLVGKESYASDQRATEERFRRLETDITSARATTKWAIGICVTVLLAMLALLGPVLLK